MSFNWTDIKSIHIKTKHQNEQHQPNWNKNESIEIYLNSIKLGYKNKTACEWHSLSFY